MEECTTSPPLEVKIKELAVAVHTEISHFEVFSGLFPAYSLPDLLRLDSFLTLSFFQSCFFALAKCVQTAPQTIDSDRVVLEQTLQKLEADLRAKVKLQIAEAENRTEKLKAELESAGRNTHRKHLREVTCITEMLDGKGTEMKVGMKQAEDMMKEEKDKLLKALGAFQANAKRDQQHICNLERKLTRLEVELTEKMDMLADKTRECEKWKTDCEILNLSSRNKDFVPSYLVFSQGRKKLSRRKVEDKSPLLRFNHRTHTQAALSISDSLTNSLSPLKPVRIKKDASAKSLVGISPSTTKVRSASEKDCDFILGKAVQIQQHRDASVREFKRNSLMRRQNP